MISLDANILVHAADKSAPARHASAQQIVRGASDAHGALTEQAIFEFFHASTRKGKISIADATFFVRELMQLSEDLQDGAQYGGVTVVNPFNVANAPLIGQLLS